MYSSCLEIARSHIRLPVNRDVNALKHVLRDWLRYTEQTPLQQKQAFPAALRIEVRRPQPPFADADLRGRIAETPLQKGLAAWRRQPGDPLFTDRVGLALGKDRRLKERESGKCPHVFVKNVPLELWTALLPWEVQRGLSGSVLEEEEGKGKGKAATPAREGSVGLETDPNRGSASPAKDEDEEEDPYGVVSTPVRQGSLDARGPPENDDGGKSNAVRPGLLFVLDAKQTQQQGAVRFWSGGIIIPIDVLFFVATQPPAVAQSPSFRGLRREDVALKLKNNELARAVAEHFFPNDELRSGLTEFKLHTHGHLDPFPSDPPGVLEGNARFDVGASFPPNAGPDQIPRFVLEAPRHLLRRSVQYALRESEKDYERVHGPCVDADADLQLTLELSEGLKAHLMAKAQLHAQYVMPLVETIVYHLRRLNRPLNSDSDRVAVGEAADGGGNQTGGDGARLQVWLSEKEQRWMTPRELAALQAEQTRKSLETPWQAQRQDDADLFDPHDNEEPTDDDHAQLFQEEAAVSVVADATTGLGSNIAKSEADPALRVRPAQPGGTSASRSIGLYSPTLAEEDEGRPSYLAPSFFGRNDANVLREHALVVNADKLARYPRTRSHLPRLPPIDYELFDLCVRLGVGHEVVMHYYYQRLLREWRQELLQLQNQGKNRAVEGAANTTSSSRLHDDDVQRMVRLVRDSSLQVPDELRFLVEEVHQHREEKRSEEKE
ncbi:unnamed protein product [Phytomonas sp. EM1]|nr:unnamed protein product [Phytomonas sp. EM1]|eukprot:CCW63934.1 unnamed protein product [Phytomonas sp. isolate EM1]